MSDPIFARNRALGPGIVLSRSRVAPLATSVSCAATNDSRVSGICSVVAECDRKYRGSEEKKRGLLS
jgi:hypothetical protein